MCDHENRNCPGKRCRCECMTCLFGESDDYPEDAYVEDSPALEDVPSYAS